MLGRTRLVGLGIAAAAALLLAVQHAGRDDTGTGALAAGYERRVLALLEGGDADAALAELDRATLLDAGSIALLKRLGAAAPLAREIRIDAGLRARIAARMLEDLEASGSMGAGDPALLDRALANCSLLVELEPETARSHQLLGMTHLVRGSATSAPIEYIKAASHLRRALEIDPDLPGVNEALRFATTRARR